MHSFEHLIRELEQAKREQGRYIDPKPVYLTHVDVRIGGGYGRRTPRAYGLDEEKED